MKKYNPIYYLFFILLIMGAFASMAQNNYGIKIMGAVAIAFGFVFLVEFITELRKKGKKDMYALAEPLCLFILSIVFALRVFYLRFAYVELLFAAAALLLALIYLRKLIQRFRQLKPKNNFLAILLFIFHLSIILFLASLALIPFLPKISEATGAGAFILLLIFLAAALFRRNILVDGESVSAFQMITQFKDHSIIIVSLFLLFSLYVSFTRIGVLPAIYSDEYPQAYFNLVNKAASKEEKPVDGRYKHEDFMEKYQQFLKHNKVKDQ